MNIDKQASGRRKTPLLPEKLRSRLYPVVLDLFSRKDFHQVNMREICKRSGLSLSTVYKYFPSKEALLFTILDRKISEIGVLMKTHLEGLESTKEIFRKVFWVTMDYYDKNPGVAITAGENGNWWTRFPVFSTCSGNPCPLLFQPLQHLKVSPFVQDLLQL
jgi:AcrR family transcriptional regulator